MGLPWESPVTLQLLTLANVPDTPGVYRLMTSTNDISSIGQSKTLGRRLRTHARSHQAGEYQVSFALLPGQVVGAQLLEIENDLLGAYWRVSHKIPIEQFHRAE